MRRGLGRKSASSYGALGPLAFVRSGNVDLNSGSASGVGRDGYGRSRTARSSTGAYYLSFNPTDIYPSGTNGS